MEFSTGDLITIVGVILGAGVTLGQIRTLQERTAALTKGAVARGERLEALNTRVTVIEDRIGGRPRRQTLLPEPPHDGDHHHE